MIEYFQRMEHKIFSCKDIIASTASISSKYSECINWTFDIIMSDNIARAIDLARKNSARSENGENYMDGEYTILYMEYSMIRTPNISIKMLMIISSCLAIS